MFIYFYTYVQCFLGSKKYSSHTLQFLFYRHHLRIHNFLLLINLILGICMLSKMKNKMLKIKNPSMNSENLARKETWFLHFVRYGTPVSSSCSSESSISSYVIERESLFTYIFEICTRVAMISHLFNQNHKDFTTFYRMFVAILAYLYLYLCDFFFSLLDKDTDQILIVTHFRLRINYF